MTVESWVYFKIMSIIRVWLDSIRHNFTLLIFYQYAQERITCTCSFSQILTCSVQKSNIYCPFACKTMSNLIPHHNSHTLLPIHWGNQANIHTLFNNSSCISVIFVIKNQ